MQLKGKEHLTYRGTMIQIMPDVSSLTTDTKHNRTYGSKQTKIQTSIIYPVKISFEKEGKMDFLRRMETRKCITSKSALEEVFQVEGNDVR